MKGGLWVWPTEPRNQARMLRKIAQNNHLVTALKAISASKEGLSNAELDEVLGDNSEWLTLWVVRQLQALGFIDYKVDLFGGPSRYIITDLGKKVSAQITPQAVQPTAVPPLARVNPQ
ncbi:MAG: hypothetical protein OK422_03365 [Thaumarchaeota archaeon]|nr:hypothetical protein [Nitrososphaerota archaeon]